MGLMTPEGPPAKVGLVRRTGQLLAFQSVRQWVVIVMTILVPALLAFLPATITVGPVGLPLFLPFRETVGPFDIGVRVAAYGIWIPLAALSLMQTFRQDKVEVERIVVRGIEGPVARIQELKDELQETKTAQEELTERVTEMECDLRRIGSHVGVVVPVRARAREANFTFGVSPPSVTVRNPPIRWPVRCGRWAKRQATRLWKGFCRWLY